MKKLIVVIERGVIQGIASDTPDEFMDVDVAIVDYGDKIDLVNPDEKYEQMVEIKYTHVMQASIPLDEIFVRPDEPQEDSNGTH